MTDSEPKTSEAANRDLVGRIIGKYEIVRLIGGGGMGKVYEGLNTAIGKRVALKFIEDDGAAPDAVARFQREAQAASAVESAHIVEIFDSGETDDGMPFIVMELLRGEDLGHRIRRLGKLDLQEALTITAQILRGLFRAHEAGILHRDLKPDNVFLLDRDDDQIFAKIVDFGVSKVMRRGEAKSTTITQEGTVLGTPVYMSPEQAQAQSDVDGRADLYSVGAILYESLCGRPPHSGGTYEQVIVNICMKDADDVRLHNPDVPESVAKVIAKALTRDREARYATARDFLDDLISESAGILSGRSISSSDVQGNARASRTVVRSGSSSSGSKTLGAVSTVAAVPPELAKSGAQEPGSRTKIYAFVGVGAFVLGGVAVVFFVNNGGSKANEPAAGPVIITLHDGPVASGSAAASAEATTSIPTPTAPAVAMSTVVSASPLVEPTASATASAAASTKPRALPNLPPPPQPSGAGLHILPR